MKWKWYGPLGLAIVIGAEILLFLRVELVTIWFTPIVWTGYILFVDSLVLRLRGESLIHDRLKEFLMMLWLSIFFWLMFEVYNLLLKNWYYVNLPSQAWQRNLGYGWAFVHERRLYEYPDNSVIIRYACGFRDKFVYSGGAYVTPADGMDGQLTQTGAGTYEFLYNNGYRDYYDEEGRLVASADPQGNRHEFTYDAAGKMPLVGTSPYAVDPSQPMIIARMYRLTRIDERAADGTLTGHYVTFSYDSNTGRLTGLATSDGRSISYEHDVTTDGLTKGNLTRVVGLEGLESLYGYTDPNDDHNLTSLQEGVNTTPHINTFDAQDRIIQQVHGNNTLAIEYLVPQTQTRLTRTITDAAGQNPVNIVELYDFDAAGNARVTNTATPSTAKTKSPAKKPGKTTAA